MFNQDKFIEECVAAVRQENSHRAVYDLMASAVSDPAAIFKEFGEPTKAGFNIVHRSKTVTILNIIWPGYMSIQPHNHLMWSAIGIYSGREDNIYWRRLPTDGGSRIEAAGARAISAGEVLPQGKDIVHSVFNPLPRMTCALHIYGGDYFDTARSEWDPEFLTERELDLAAVQRRFDAS